MLSRAEFDARCDRLEQLRGDLSQTSGVRSVRRNDAVGGVATSRHVKPRYGQAWHGARDYVADGMPWSGASAYAQISELEMQAKILGLWATVHGEGLDQHLHVQSAPPAGWDYGMDGW